MNKHLSDIEDQLLVMDAQVGDLRAMEKLVGRWQKRLWFYAYRLTHNKDAAVLSLYYFEELSISEISTALNIPKGTVKSRLAGARKELKELWQKHYE